MIRVMLVDDQREVRDGLRLMMSKFADLHVVSRCANGAEAMEELRCLDASGAALPDVVLMDVRMPVMDGIDATRRIVRSWPSVRVLVLTTYDQDDYAFGALAVGASGFLLKDSAVGTIVGAIRSVAAGDAVLSPRVTRELIARVIPNRTPSASDRFSVLGGLRGGLRGGRGLHHRCRRIDGRRGDGPAGRRETALVPIDGLPHAVGFFSTTR